ncbi:MAG TPA: alpha/beta fold hydrolase [Hyphomicrobiaceae bacterium]|nr:alpha/beta fold hydrolase [Hyphomicrobiaceae bacterium]
MRARVNGIDLHYVVSGRADAPPVLLHHPLATNLTIWDELTAALEPHYRVIRFDARGHGTSDAPKGAYTFETLTGDVVGLLDHLGLAKVRYLGLSMGGFVGQYLGLLHPHRVHSLCLVSTSSNMAALGREIWDERIRIVDEQGMTRSVVDGALARWLSPDALKSRPELVARLRAMIEATPPAGYVGWCHAIRALDITDRIRAIRLPTKVIAGELDPATPPAGARVIHEAIAGSQFVVLPGVSHMLHVEAPAAFHREVLPFLAEHGPSA